MAKTKRSTPVNASVLGATKVVGTAVAAPAGSGSTAASSTAAGSTGSGIPSSAGAPSSTGTVLVGLGVANTGFTQVQAKTLVSSAFETKVEKRLNGVENFLPAGTSLLINGTTYTVASIVSVLEAVLALFTAKATAEAQAKAQVSAATAALKAELPTASQFITGLDGALVQLLCKGNPVLGNFGLSTGVKKKPSSGTLAVGKAKAKATRAVLGTKGKVQKAEVLADVRGAPVTVSPSGEVSLPAAGGAGSSPAASTPSAQPAGGSSSGTGSTSGQ